MPREASKKTPPPFIYAFCVIVNAREKVFSTVSSGTGLLTAWRHLSKYVLCFELPEEADVTARTASVVDSASITAIRWDKINRDKYEGVLYVRKGLSGMVHRFDKEYSQPSAADESAARQAIAAKAGDFQARKDAQA